MIDRFKVPAFKAPGKFVLMQPDTTKLDNGVPVHVFNVGSVPVIKIEFIFPAGKWFEEKKGAAFFCAKMLAEGSLNYTSNQIADVFDQYGVNFEISPGPDYVGLAFYANKRHFVEVLPIIRELIFEPIFPSKELEFLKNIQFQQLKVNREKINFIATKLFKSQLFGESHPYGQNMDEQQIADMDREDLIKFYRNNFNSSCEVILSGQIDLEILPLVNEFFGQRGKFELKEFKDRPSTGKLGSIEETKPGSLQASIKIGKELVKKDHPDFIPLLLLNEAFGGYFGSRLMQNIREDKGYSYGIYSSLVSLKNAGYFIISTDAKKEYSKQTIQEIKKELDLLSNKEIGDSELTKVKNYIKGSFLSGITTPFALADKFMSVHFYDLDYHYYDSFFEIIDAVRPSELKTLAQKYLDFDKMTRITVQ